MDNRRGLKSKMQHKAMICRRVKRYGSNFLHVSFTDIFFIILHKKTIDDTHTYTHTKLSFFYHHDSVIDTVRDTVIGKGTVISILGFKRKTD